MYPNTFTAVTNPAQERFYEQANSFIDRNKTELRMVEAYGEYRVWKGFFSSDFVRIPIYVAFIFVCSGVDKLTQDGGTWASILVAGCLSGLFLCAVAIAWKILKLLLWPVRYLRDCYDIPDKPWYLGYESERL
jgi:hypothetical protein